MVSRAGSATVWTHSAGCAGCIWPTQRTAWFLLAVARRRDRAASRFEVLSPSNSQVEMANKLRFYDQYGVDEYYLYDPEKNHLEIWLRQGASLKRVSHLNGWVSPRLGIRLALTPETLELYTPDGRPFLNSVELARWAESAEARANQEAQRAESAEARANQEAQRANQEAQHAAEERSRAERLAERLRALGVDLSHLED